MVSSTLINEIYAYERIMNNSGNDLKKNIKLQDTGTRQKEF